MLFTKHMINGVKQTSCDNQNPSVPPGRYTSDMFVGLVSPLQNRFDKRAINSRVDLLTKPI